MAAATPVITGAIFEHGLEVSEAPNSINLLKRGRCLYQIFDEVRETYNLRPILLTQCLTFGERKEITHSVLTLDGNESLDVRLSSLRPPEGIPQDDYSAMIRPSLNVQYAAGALVYHCKQLALHYSQMCDQAVWLAQLKPISENPDEFGFSGQAEAWYEIEALITAARRTYDSLRFVLCAAFGKNDENIPRNFQKAIASCNNLPSALKSKLESSWASVGKKMTNYRDCIQHNAPLSNSLQTVILKRVKGGEWSATLLLPDNPEAKSQTRFVYRSKLDALTYGWELANEVIDVAAEVFANLKPRRA